jgi:phage gp16-like protein
MISNIAKIKIAQKQLNMEDDAYRALLQRLTGKRSAAALTVTEQCKVLAAMVQLGWKPSKPRKAQGKSYTQPHSRKLIMLWKDLYQSGHITNKTNAALESWCKSETGKASPDWLSPAEAKRLIEALKSWAKRPVKAGETP